MLGSARYPSSVASSGAASSNKSPGGFNRNAYGGSGRRSPTGSVASASTARGWAKPEKPRTAVDMDSVRGQENLIRRAKKASEYELFVSDDGSD